MTKPHDEQLDDLVWEHLQKIGILIRPEIVKGEFWHKADGYWWRWVRVYIGGGKTVRRCYRVNDDLTVERMV